MKLIGKLDDALVYEVDRGQYIVVDPETKRWTVTWSWYAQLGRACDSFTKLEHSEEDDECLDVIEDNLPEMLDALNALDDEGKSKIRGEYMEEQDDFYEGLDENREYNWYSGYEDEIEG